jgi:hypothetical protein
MDNTTISILILCGVDLLLGVALFIHVRQEPKDAHGKDRKFL